MNFEDAAKRLDPEIYQRFKTAMELGKWPDGTPLSAAQKEICLQAVMMYEAQHNVPEADRVGYIDRSKRNKSNGNEGDDDSDVSPLRVLH